MTGADNRMRAMTFANFIAAKLNWLLDNRNEESAVTDEAHRRIDGLTVITTDMIELIRDLIDMLDPSDRSGNDDGR